MSAAVEETPLADAEARRRIAREHGTTFVVEAAAGTGKTTALVRRIAGLVCEGGVAIEEVVAASFTERAAGEIVLRLRTELEARRGAPSPAERRRAEAAIAHLEEARIGTLHAVFTALLRERPIEAGLEPDFIVLGEHEARALRSRALRGWLGKALGRSAPGVTRFVRLPARWGEDDPVSRLERVFANVLEHRDLTAPWTRRTDRDRPAELDALTAEVAELAAFAERGGGSAVPLQRHLEGLGRWHADLARRERHGTRDHDALERELVDLLGASRSDKERAWGATGRGKEFGPGIPLADVLARRDALRSRLVALAGDADAELASLVREELTEPLREYEALKAHTGALDFLDIALRLSGLLEASADARRAMFRAARYVLCDEAQDCDPREIDVLSWLALAEGESDPRAGALAPGRLFVVGDPKQAIYGFRRASLSAYLGLRDELCARGAVRLELRSSFRSTPSICGVVDRALGPELVESRHQAGYVALAPTTGEPDDLSSVIALPVPRPLGANGRVGWTVVQEALPDLVARHVAWMVRESGWKVRDPESGERRPMRWSDVALLFKGLKRFEHDVGGAFARALERLEVPHAYPGGISFHDQAEVAALRTALTAIEWPDDALSVFATLRGPFFALGDAALLSYTDRFGKPSPFGVPRADARAAASDEVLEVAAALDVLRELHVRRRHRSIPATVEAFLEATRARVTLALAADGEIALARVGRVLDRARRAESEGALSFRAFVEALEAQAEARDDETRRGQGPDHGVKLLSAHGGKGLEFPVVVLADPTVSASRREPGRFVDVARGLWAESVEGLRPRELGENRDEALEIEAGEARRLLYVAATRARDVLVIPTTGIETLNAWIAPLEHAVRRVAQNGRRTSTSAPGAPPFGARSLLGEDERGGEIRPGTYEHEGVRVTYWDPALLEGAAAVERALRGLDLVREGPGEEDGRKSARAHAEARLRTTREAATGARDVRTTEAAGRMPLAAAAVEAEVEVIEAHLERAHDAARGRRAAALLARLTAQLPATEAIVAAESADVRAEPAERALVIAALERLASVPAVVEALSAASLRRDVPVTLAVGARTLAEGRISLVVVPETGDVVAIDTTLARGDDLESVRVGLALRATGLGRAFERGARGVLVVL